KHLASLYALPAAVTIGYSIYVTCLVAVLLFAAPLQAQCGGGCNYNPASCPSPCGSEIDAQDWLDSSCPSDCCYAGICWTLNDDGGSCYYPYDVCDNSDFGFCDGPAGCG